MKLINYSNAPRLTLILKPFLSNRYDDTTGDNDFQASFSDKFDKSGIPDSEASFSDRLETSGESESQALFFTALGDSDFSQIRPIGDTESQASLSHRVTLILKPRVLDGNPNFQASFSDRYESRTRVLLKCIQIYLRNFQEKII